MINNNIGFLIGIDPDVSKSGVCLYNKHSKSIIELTNLTFFELFDYLNIQKSNAIVYIEAGWLNKSNWHTLKNGSSAVNAKIGQHTGANHEVGKKIVEMCIYIGIEHILVKPIKSKLNADTFTYITKYNRRTNQEQRDATMLVYGR